LKEENRLKERRDNSGVLAFVECSIEGKHVKFDVKVWLFNLWRGKRRTREILDR